MTDTHVSRAKGTTVFLGFAFLGFFSAPVLRTEVDLQIGLLYVSMFLTSLLLDEHNLLFVSLC